MDPKPPIPSLEPAGLALPTGLALPAGLIEAALAQAGDGILITEVDTTDTRGPRVVYVNDAYTRMTGYPRDELVGRSPRLFSGAKTPRREVRRIAEAMARGEPATAAVVSNRRDGSELHARLTLAPLRDGEGRVTHFVIMQHEVGEDAHSSDDLRAAKEELEQVVSQRTGELSASHAQIEREAGERRRAESLLRAVLDTLPATVVVLDRRGVIVATNAAWDQAASSLPSIDGTRRGVGSDYVALTKNAADRGHEGARLHLPVLQQILSGSHTTFQQTTPLAVDGRGRVLRFDSLSLPPAVGGAVIIGVDVTDLAQTEEELRHASSELESRMAQQTGALQASEERYRLLFEHAGEAIFILEADDEGAGKILEANRAAAVMHGREVAELKTMCLVDLDAPEVAGGTPGNIRRIGDGEWIAGETLHVREGGARFPVEYTAGPLDVGGARLIITFMRDITARKQAEEALRQAKKDADAASRAKSAFLANMSHEIRTPLNAVLGYAQLIRRDPQLSREHHQHIEVISRSGEHLLGLINDVLEMSKIEAGYRKLQRGDVDLWALLGDLGRMFRLRADAKQLTFEIQRSADLPRHVVADDGKLRQMLINLLSNAVKFTSSGKVSVRVLSKRGPAGEQRLVVEVEDTGPGIGADKVGALFQPFSQTRVGIQAQGGTGLGLALSREFARLMKGDITVESRPGKGSVFRLDLPIELGRAPAVEHTPPKGRVMALVGAARRLRVLVVDDEVDSRSWVRALLLQVGFDVREAADGAAALRCFDEWRPHLVLMDMHMPVMDGYAATRAMRGRPTGQRTAIVAVTASAFEEERDAIVEAGADAVLRKPCREGDLLEEIRKQLGIEYQYGEEPPPERTSHVPDVMAMRHEHVRRLAPQLVADMREAVKAADYERLTELIAKIPSEHGAVAEALRELCERYGYDEIETILGS